MTRTLIFSGLVIIGLRGSRAVQASTATGTFALTGSLNIARYNHTATLLPSGGYLTALRNAELYTP